MIEFENLKEKLLEKALTSSKVKDISKLVLVKKEKKGKNGKITYQGYWIDPTKEKIEHHLKVLANHHNLPDGHPQKVPETTSNSVSPLKSHSKDDVTLVADSFHSIFANTDEFLNDLKKRGITWTEGSEPKTNVMRAKMALKAAIKNGYDPFQNGSHPPNVVPTKDDKKSSGTDIKMDMKTPVSPESKQKATEFFEKVCNKDRPTFYSKLKAMGVKWVESTKDSVNFMFAKRMFSLAIDKGLDPYNPTPQVQKPVAQSTNSIKSDKDESLLEVPADATEREKNLIEFINKMNKIDEIQGCTRVGIVPEDDRSKSYILNKLQVRIAVAVMNPDNDEWFKDVDKNGKKRFPAELREEIKKSWGKDVLENLISQAGFGKPKDVFYDKTSLGFGKAVADQLILDGCKKSSIAEGFKQVANFDMEMLVNPRNRISNTGKTIRPGKILQALNEGYSDYTTDAYSGEYLTNLGYTGFSPEEYKQRYSLDKEGVVKYLNKIKSENPQLKSKVDEMISIYDETMKSINYNPHVLNLILSSSNWTIDSIDDYKLTNFGKTLPKTYADATKAVKYADHLSNLVIGELTNRGYGHQAILDALKNVEINDCLRNFEIKNDKGGIDVIDFTQCKNPDGTNAVVIRRAEHEWGSGLLAYTQAKYMEQQNIPLNSTDPDNLKAMKNSLDFYDMAKQMSKVTEDDYKNVHKSILKMFGIKYVDNNGNDVDYSTIDAAHSSWKNPGIKQVKLDENPSTDLILANMVYGRFFHDVNSAISESVTNNAKSKMNDNGKDYSKNFDYYSGSVMKDATQRFTQLGNSEATYTASELSSKISKQLEQVPSLSIDYLSKLKTYYATTTKNPQLDNFKSDWGRTTNAYLDNPIKDFLYQLAENVSTHTPITAEKPTFGKLTAKRLNYVPFDFNLKQQPRLVKEKVKSTPKPTPQELKAARQALLEAANCSLGTLDEVTTRKLWREMSIDDFDYKKGQKTLWGEIEMEPAHTIRDDNGKIIYTNSYNPDTMTYNKVLLLNEPLFKINNSNFEEKFYARQKKMMDSGKFTEENYKARDAYTGTSYWSGANICGREGEFYINKKIEKVGTMLGSGPYFGLVLGKCCPYVGNEPYSSQKLTKLDREQADGLIIKAKIMLGERFVKNAYESDIKNPLKTFLARDATDPAMVRQYVEQKRRGINPGFTVLKDIELCGKDNDLILPEIIADTSSRVQAFNIQYDEGTGYHDINTNELTHDKDGISTSIQWK